MTLHSYTFVAHFTRRCAERSIPLDAARVVELARRTAACWREAGRRRYRLSVRLGRGRLVTVVWDDAAGEPVTAWWAARDALDPVDIHGERR